MATYSRYIFWWFYVSGTKKFKKYIFEDFWNTDKLKKKLEKKFVITLRKSKIIIFSKNVI